MEKGKNIYGVGQILTYTQDVETRRALSDTPEIIKKGTKCIVGADGFVRYQDGSIQRIGDSIKVAGYSTQGLASFIYSYLLRNVCGFSEMVEDWETDITEDCIKENIADALEELGMYDHTGNRS